jgi:hypothetical protein
MDEPGRLPVCDLDEERSSVLLAFDRKDKDEDGPSGAPLVPVCAAIAFL